MSNVAIITARGNNESIPDKNIIKVAGKPAMSYIIEAAKASETIDDIVVSTDCDKIAELSLAAGCKVIMRPPELALPDANHGDVIAHAVRTVNDQFYPDLDIVTILLGNTVMLDGGLIDMSVKILQRNSEIDSVMSVWLAQDDHPYRALKIDENGFLRSFVNVECGTSRQYYPKVYFYDQGIWTLRHQCAFERSGPNPWWWMGKNSFPIIRRWVTGRDFHTQLDLDFSACWINQSMRDVIDNIKDVERLLGNQ